MIRINLLPPTMRAQHVQQEKGKSTVLLGNKILSYGIGGAAAVLAAAYFVLVFVPGWFTQMRLAGWQRQWKSMEKQFEEVNAYAVQEKLLLSRFGELNKKNKERVRWAKVLNAISDVVPSSIQLVRISSGPLMEMVPMPLPHEESPGRTVTGAVAGQPPAQKIRHTYWVLELEGLAEKGLLGEEDLNALLEQMRLSDVFSQTFERIELVGVVTLPDAKKKFSLRCRFKENTPWQPSQG